MKRILFTSLAIVAGFVGIVGLSSFIGSESTTLKLAGSYYYTGNDPANDWDQEGSYEENPSSIPSCDTGSIPCKVTPPSNMELQEFLDSFEEDQGAFLNDGEHVETRSE